MSKLLSLRPWLLLHEAAAQASALLQEPVSEADLIRLGLDAGLVVSVHIFNGATATVWRAVELEDMTYTLVTSPLAVKDEFVRIPGVEHSLLETKYGERIESGELFPAPDGLVIDVRASELSSRLPLLRRLAHLASEPGSERSLFGLVSDRDDPGIVSGVFDLPMIGGERLDLEHRFQQMFSGAPITDVALEGAFAVAEDGRFLVFQERFEEEHRSGDHFHDRRDWFPSGGLPHDSQFVIRTKNLLAFLSEALPTTPRAEARASRTDLRIIGALLELVKSNGAGKEEAIIAELEERFGHQGPRTRTLQQRFSDAKKALGSGE